MKRLCRQWNVRLKVYRENVPAYAKEHGMTEEEAGRDIRRTCFCKVLKEWGGTKIALAHHENDNVETLLWNLCRGTGIRGLGGIAPVNDVWIRPLLCVKRREIESYLKKRGISYCTDTTNADRRYMRNRIRMDVIPYLEDCVNTESVSHMGKTMERMYELEQYILEEVGKYKESCTGWKNGRRIIRQTEYTKIPKALREDVYKRQFHNLPDSSNKLLFIDIKEEEFDQMKEIAVEILKSMSQQYKESMKEILELSLIHILCCRKIIVQRLKERG